MQIAKMNMLARGIVIAGCLFWYAAAIAGETELSQALSRVKIFSELTDAERTLMKTAAQLRQGKAGEQIISQDMAMGRMIVILDGQVGVDQPFHIGHMAFCNITQGIQQFDDIVTTDAIEDPETFLATQDQPCLA